LMSPLSEDGKDIINSKVKHREWFRPFGASVLDKDVSNYFDWEGESPYMLYVADVKEPDRFPSITHFDGTCRMQTVSSNHEDYYQLIEEFESLTGVPMLLNTSLNNGGRPIAGRIADALELYYQTELDTLVLGDSVHYKQ
jgi:carbamoyltransferase